jgi:hypothetical protein
MFRHSIKSHILHATRLVRHKLRDVLVPGRRSSEWPRVEREFLLTNSVCAACGGRNHLNVHHKKPFHLDPSLELNKGNLITLCMGIDRHCHLLIGHGDNFRAFNPDVEVDAIQVRNAWLKIDLQTIKAIEEKAKEKRQFELKS